MMLEREQPGLSRPALDILQRSGILAEVLALFNAITHHAPKPEFDTSIAWEDGESDDADIRRPDDQ